MGRTNGPRETCDLCYTRKLKCDRQKPLCSNCVTYSADCTHTAQSRKWKPRAGRNGYNDETSQIHGLRREVQELKAQFRRAQDQAAGRVEDQTPSDSDDASIGGLMLPPLQDTLAMVGIFLRSFNSVLPLFHADTLLRLVGECYALPPQKRDPVTWAAINIVLALASQHMTAEDGGGNGLPRTGRANEYLNKAQSVISQVMLGETRLLNIQTLVGMVAVLQTAHDVTPSLILISATMRLAHKVGLHSRASSAHLDPTESRQRDRVFWLAYIFDKSLSLRAQQPSVQLDADIDLDLPSSSPPDGEEDGATPGIVISADGKARMNFFLSRVRLAIIEGAIYDGLYAVRAVNRSREERSTVRESIVDALEKWRAAIPLAFTAAVVTSSTSDNPAHGGFFCVLHSTSLQCMALINRTHAWDEQWVTGLREIGSGAWELRLPSGWEGLVIQARAFMGLFGEMWTDDVWFRWMASCSYITAMILLIANDLLDLEHETQLDNRLVDAALSWLDDRVGEGQSDDVRVIRDVCIEAAQRGRKRQCGIMMNQTHQGNLNDRTSLWHNM